MNTYTCTSIYLSMFNWKTENSRGTVFAFNHIPQILAAVRVWMGNYKYTKSYDLLVILFFRKWLLKGQICLYYSYSKYCKVHVHLFNPDDKKCSITIVPTQNSPMLNNVSDIQRKLALGPIFCSTVQVN